MRILQINQCHYKRGGADIVYLNTIALLKSMGHEVACFSTKNEQNEDSPFSGYFVPSCNLRNQSLGKKISAIRPYINNREAYKCLERLIKDFKPDVAHVHLFYATLSVSILDALKNNNIPVLHTVHDYRLLCPVNSFLDSKGNICETCAKGYAINSVKKRCSDGKLTQSAIVALEALYWRNFNSPISKVDSFHFVSDFCRNKHIEYHPQIKDKSVVFYNFNSLPNFEQKKSNEKYYLYYGRLSTEKGILTLVDAWKGLANHMKLKIVGSGLLLKQIQNKIKDLNLLNIELLGYKQGSELYQLIQNAHFVIIPSEWYENNPMTIVESYSLGTPVIGSNIGGIPEIIVEKETGYIFETKNRTQLQKKIQNAEALSTEQYAEFSRNALKFSVKHFSRNSYYEQLVKVYSETILKVKPFSSQKPIS